MCPASSAYTLMMEQFFPKLLHSVLYFGKLTTTVYTANCRLQHVDYNEAVMQRYDD
jgi:hypothetical protein